MKDYQVQFIRFALQHEALLFGEFTLKSGRVSPYFFNAGQFNSGKAIAELGRYYAAAIVASKLDYDILFGPAYKGIPLATATAIALANNHDIDMPYCFDRKEAKDHAEGGMIVGAPLEGHVLAIDDVISAGTTIHNTTRMLERYPATLSAFAIAMDRQECGNGQTSAIDEAKEKFGIEIISIVTLDDVISYLAEIGGKDDLIVQIRAYCEEHGSY